MSLQQFIDWVNDYESEIEPLLQEIKQIIRIYEEEHQEMQRLEAKGRKSIFTFFLGDEEEDRIQTLKENQEQRLKRAKELEKELENILMLKLLEHKAWFRNFTEFYNDLNSVQRLRFAKMLEERIGKYRFWIYFAAFLPRCHAHPPVVLRHYITHFQPKTWGKVRELVNY